jgi:hypothetical protein
MLRITSNFGLDDAATGTQTGTVGEPSVAASRTGILVTGNWYASWSPDAGASWDFVDPFTTFPSAPGRMCCDQLVLWIPSVKLWVWLLQYNGVGGTNVLRMAVSPTAQAHTWHWWDLAPSDLSTSWKNVWFDYPDVGYTDQHLWITSNVYAGDVWQRAVVIKYPLSELGVAKPITRRHWTTTSAGSLRLVQGATDTMWFASSDIASRSVRLFAWPDASDSVTSWSIRVTAWKDGPYRSTGPDGRTWLARLDDRITGAWRANGRLGFLWSASPSAGRPQPYVRAAVIDEATLKLVAEPDLWSKAGAWAYPAAAPNRKGRVGLTAFYGGATHPAHCVGVLDEKAGTWTTATAAVSTSGPSDGLWGDYVVCRPHPTRSTSWIASGFTMQGSANRRDIEPRVVTFRA